MRLLFDNCKIYDSDRLVFKPGKLLVGGGKIINIFDEYSEVGDYDTLIDCFGADIIPGLIDIHTHGRGGYDFSDADRDGMKAMAKSYALSGVTSLFPTLASAPFERLCDCAEMISSLKGKTGGAEFLGVHLEGRYLNPTKAGAHSVYMLHALDINELERFIRSSGLPCRISAAFELAGGEEFAFRARELGATLSMAHTEATYAQAMKLCRDYDLSFSHLYNAMTPIHHRDGGCVMAAFDSGAYCELICDGFHISPEVIAFTLRNVGISRLILVTDSMAAAGAPDGDYEIAGSPAIVRGGIARTPSGVLAGSTLSLVNAVENLARFTRITIEEALVCATINPARATGIQSEVGSLIPDSRADLAIVNISNGKLVVDSVFVAGEQVV